MRSISRNNLIIKTCLFGDESKVKLASDRVLREAHKEMESDVFLKEMSLRGLKSIKPRNK